MEKKAYSLTWSEFYNQEVIPNRNHKCLYFSYKGSLHEFEWFGYFSGIHWFAEEVNVFDGTYIYYDVILKYGKRFETIYYLYNTFKEAVDKQVIADNKTLKDIWDDPEFEILSFEADPLNAPDVKRLAETDKNIV